MVENGQAGACTLSSRKCSRSEFGANADGHVVDPSTGCDSVPARRTTHRCVQGGARVMYGEAGETVNVPLTLHIVVVGRGRTEAGMLTFAPATRRRGRGPAYVRAAPLGAHEEALASDARLLASRASSASPSFASRPTSGASSSPRSAPGPGTYLAAVALTVDVFDRTGSGKWVSALLLVEFLPIILIGILAGPLIDRLSRRRLLIVSDLVRALVFCALPFAGSATMIIVLAAIQGVATGFFRPAVYAGMPNLVDDEQLPTATSLLQTIENLTWMIGPVIGGVILSAWGPDLAYWVNAVTFVVSAILLARIPAAKTPGGPCREPRTLGRHRRRLPGRLAYARAADRARSSGTSSRSASARSTSRRWRSRRSRSTPATSASGSCSAPAGSASRSAASSPATSSTGSGSDASTSTGSR